MSKIHLEILVQSRQVVFQKLSPFKKYGYLAGGTALALQIKHRKSVDFDVFIYKPISTKFRFQVKKYFDVANFYVDTSDQISFTTKDEIGITFVWYYYKPIASLVQTSSLSLSSVADIAADKAHTLGRRAVWRDYVDLFWMMKYQILSLSKIVDVAKRKFGGDFNEAQFLEQLSYFKDLEVVPMEFIDVSYTSQEIQNFLSEQVDAYLKKIL